MVVGGVAAMSASSAFADITVSDSGFSGSIDTKYFLTAAAIIATLLGVVAAVKYGIAMFRK